MLLEGMHLPLTTPFYPDGRLNLRKLQQNVAHYSLTPAAGMVVLGQNGEAGLLSDQETREVLRTAIDAAASAKVMLAGVARDSVLGTLELLEDVASMGYDAAIVNAPVFAGCGPKELRLYFESVADHSPLPIILTGALPIDLTAQLAHHPRIIGSLQDFSAEEVKGLLERTTSIKRSVTVTQIFGAVTGRMLAESGPENSGLVLVDSLTGGAAVMTTPTKPTLKTRTKVVGFQLLVSRTADMLQGLSAGAVGAVPAFSAAAPQGCYEVMAAWKDGDPALAEEKQQRLLKALHGVEEAFGTRGIKYGCDLNGYFGGVPRLPLLPLTGDEKATITELMLGLKS